MAAVFRFSGAPTSKNFVDSLSSVGRGSPGRQDTATQSCKRPRHQSASGTRLRIGRPHSTLVGCRLIAQSNSIDGEWGIHLYQGPALYWIVYVDAGFLHVDRRSEKHLACARAFYFVGLDSSPT